jgi:hypothetical protein
MSNRPRRKKTEEENKNVTKKGMLNNLEMFGIGIFCLVLILYSLTKCMNDPSTETSLNDKPQDVNSTEIPQLLTRKIDTSSFKKHLYITTDSLRMRKKPERGSEIVAYLKYGEEVIDLGERTGMEKIKISVDDTRSAPWIKIKTKTGKKGWAFGAYIQFYQVHEHSNHTVINEESSHQY